MKYKFESCQENDVVKTTYDPINNGSGAIHLREKYYDMIIS